MTGVQSRIREIVVGVDYASPVVLPESNFRAMIKAETMRSDPETADLLAQENAQAFMGPGAAIISYPISQGKLFKLAILSNSPRAASGKIEGRIGLWNEPTDLESFRAMFKDFCPVARRLIGFTDEVAGWTIAEVPLLPTWSSDSGNVVLLGDALHAMAPHAAQGSAMAIEDAAVLAECLDVVVDPTKDLLHAIRKYESIRKPRVEHIAAIARNNGGLWVLPDGTEQQKRDERFKEALAADEAKMQASKGTKRASELVTIKADKFASWLSPELMMWIYGHDAIASAHELF